MQAVGRSILPKAALIAFLSLGAGCATAPAPYSTLAKHCRDRDFDGGRCDQPTNFRLFGPNGALAKGLSR